MSPRTLSLQNQIRSTTSGIEYQDDLSLSLAEDLVNEAFLTDGTQVSGTLIMDLNFLRTAVRDIKGGTPSFNWNDPSSTASTVTLIDLSEARTEITNLQNFTGSDGDGDATPDYDSLCFIAQNDPLETAVSTLDEQLCIATGTISQANEVQRRVLIRTGGQVPENTTIDINAPGAGWTVTGDDIQLTTSGTFVEASKVYTNGILQLLGPDDAADNDVYWVAPNYDIAFEYKLKQNDVIQIYKFPSVP
jgi:hypothetical protein